jgi:hypothetical protein
MPHYFVPTTGSLDELAEITQKSGLHLSTPVTVRDLILEAHEYSHAVFAVSTEILLILNRNASQLLAEMPSVVLSVPGLVYSSDWNIAATAYHVVDFTELRDKLSKSGVVSHSVEDLEKRDRGTMAEDNSTRSSLREWRNNQVQNKELVSDEDVITDVEDLP